MRVAPTFASVVVLTLFLSCAAETARSPYDGPAFAVTVAALELPETTDACYGITVYDDDPATDTDPVAVLEDLCASQFGDGQASISYVAPCVAQPDGRLNTVELVLDALYDDGEFPSGTTIAPSTYVNPCPAASPCRLARPCYENADTLVEFNLVVMRDAGQGFFDIVVEFEDIFCSAKVDIQEDLLHYPPPRDDRGPTVIVGLACTSGGMVSHLYMSNLWLVCDDGVGGRELLADIEPGPGEGNLGPQGPGTYQTAVYAGLEAFEDFAKCYWNTAIGLDVDVLGANCTLYGKAAASETLWDRYDWMFSSEPEVFSPIIRFRAPLTDATGALILQNQGLDQTPYVWTDYTHPPERAEFASWRPCPAPSDENRPPVAVEDHWTFTPTVPRPFSLLGWDPDDDPITYPPIPGVDGMICGPHPNRTYHQGWIYPAHDGFSFAVSDGALASNVATVDFTPSPYATDVCVETAPDTSVAVTLPTIDIDLDYMLGDLPDHGDISGVPPDLVYTPDPGYSGQAILNAPQCGPPVGPAAVTAALATLPAGPTTLPGAPPPSPHQSSTDRAGSVLIFPRYSSGGNAATENTSFALTNINTTKPIQVHLFFVTDSGVADSFICLTANQTATMLLSDLDPGAEGEMIAVATDELGCPIDFNFLIGTARIKQSSGIAGEYKAFAVPALAHDPTGCRATYPLGNDARPHFVTLDFNDQDYAALPRQVASDHVDVDATTTTAMTLARLGHDLALATLPFGAHTGRVFTPAGVMSSFNVPGDGPTETFMGSDLTALAAAGFGWLDIQRPQIGGPPRELPLTMVTVMKGQIPEPDGGGNRTFTGARPGVRRSLDLSNTATGLKGLSMTIPVFPTGCGFGAADAEPPTDFPPNPATAVHPAGGHEPPIGTAGSDDRAGSVLLFNYYTSSASQGGADTRITVTNTADTPVHVHLFFYDTPDLVTDRFISLPARGMLSYLASEVDPNVTGYLLAVAVDDGGIPIRHNHLIGSAAVKDESGHSAILPALAYAALIDLPAGCPVDEGYLAFDGAHYQMMSQTVSTDNVPSPVEGNDTRLVINRIGASPTTSLAGILYDDAIVPFSFTISDPSQTELIGRLGGSGGLVRTAPPVNEIIQAGRSGWAKLSSPEPGTAVTGAVINFNPNVQTAASAFNFGHNLRTVTATPVGIRMPIVAAPDGTGIGATGCPAVTEAALTAALAANAGNTSQLGPGIPMAAPLETSQDRLGSMLVYHAYTYSPGGTSDNTRVGMTNHHPTEPAYLHLFFVASDGSVADFYTCLGPTQTATFLVSDVEPFLRGYLLAIATDINGCPINFNFLSGTAAIKRPDDLPGGGGYKALAIPALDGNPALGCNETTETTLLRFDDVDYAALPHVNAFDDLFFGEDGERFSRLFFDRLHGDLASGMATIDLMYFVFTDTSANTQDLNVFSSEAQMTYPPAGQSIDLGEHWVQANADPPDLTHDAATSALAMVRSTGSGPTHVSGVKSAARLSIARPTPGGVYDGPAFTLPVFPPECGGGPGQGLESYETATAAGPNPSTAGAPSGGRALHAVKVPAEDQGGSLLIYSYAASTCDSDTELNLTNGNAVSGVSVAIYFVDGTTNAVHPYWVHLPPAGTIVVRASELRPGRSGYVIAVTVDAAGAPIRFDDLMGSAFITRTSGHSATLPAIGVRAFTDYPAGCDPAGGSVFLAFDGVHFGLLPRTVAMPTISSPADGNATLFVVNRMGSVTTDLFGHFFDDSENNYSYTLRAPPQIIGTLSNSFPRLTPRLDVIIPVGRSGWTKLWSLNTGTALFGAAIRFNANAATSAAAFNGGSNLLPLSYTATGISVPLARSYHACTDGSSVTFHEDDALTYEVVDLLGNVVATGRVSIRVPPAPGTPPPQF